MQYFGGKARVGKQLAKYLNGVIEREEISSYWEPFCGSCWTAMYIEHSARVLSDANTDLIALWHALQRGWVPPTTVSEEQYRQAKEGYVQPELRAFIGFGCSFAGKWFGGYARSGERNYALNAHNSLLKKIVLLQNAYFLTGDYRDVPSFLGQRSLIYCDPPYKDATGYDRFNRAFNHGAFWDTVRFWSRAGHAVYVSEYQAPTDFHAVWSHQTKTDIRTRNGKEPRTERLFRPRDA